MDPFLRSVLNYKLMQKILGLFSKENWVNPSEYDT